MANLSERIAALSPEKREILLRRWAMREQQQDVSPKGRRQVRDQAPPLRAFDRSETGGIDVEKGLAPGQGSSGDSRTYFPLSFAQERLWFLSQWNPDSAWYNVHETFRLSGLLQVSALERSLARVVQRHEVLRTTFEDHAGHPVQVIAPCTAERWATIQLPVIDLGGLPALERDQQVRLLARAQAQYTFDLATGPLVRVCLLRFVACELAPQGEQGSSDSQGPSPAQQVPQEHVLLIALHHIVCDDWSIAVLMREMITLYQAKMKGEADPLPELPIQYADYALWQREWLQGEVLDAQMAYWRKQLADLSPLELPTDHHRPAVKTDRGASQSRSLPKAVSDGLSHLCQKHDVTLFTLLLSAFQVLLMRYTGQTDISVGTPIANRTRVELEGLVGFFVNTLVLRTDLGGNPTLLELLRRVREVCLQAYAHQDIPFEKVVGVLAQGTGPIVRDTSLSPLFQVMFVLQNAPPQYHAGVRVMPLEVVGTTSKFDLTLSISETAPGLVPGGLNCALEYSTDLFEADTITRMLTHLQTLLEGIVQDPQARLSDLPLLTEEEREQVLAQGRGPTVQWNATQTGGASPIGTNNRVQGQMGSKAGASPAPTDGTPPEADENPILVGAGLAPAFRQPTSSSQFAPMGASPPLQDVCVHQLFEQQVEQTPDSVALVCEDRILTYAELNRRANQLAHHLRGLGIDPDHLVGISMQRSLEMIIGLLAVLKAGGAYLPLDPTYPQERLAWMLADSQVTIVLTHHLLDAPHLPLVDWTGKVINLETDRKVIDQARQENPLTSAAPANLAYVIYTSGSTGKPKGTMVTHANLTNFFTAMDQQIGDHVPGVWLAVTSISFDISVLEVFWTLTRGFQVVVQAHQQQRAHPLKASSKDLQFSLFYFANDTAERSRNKYRLLLEGAKFADAHNFTAVWTPERHFHPFGGLYPNPSVTSAAIAAVTDHVQIRAGSVVLPLHDPVRVAEEWAVVDNLSAGRVGISFASGWHANDFVLAPQQYTNRKKTLMEKIETVRKLWRGESISLDAPTGNTVQVKIYPQPIQPELPIWMTSSGSPETFRQAGEMGINLLTHLLGQSMQSLAEKIAIYRQAWQKHEHSGSGHVTLMLHTFIGTESAAVREKVRDPFCNYLRGSVELFGTLANSLGYDADLQTLSEDDLNAILAHGFDRYYQTSGLMGTVSTCLPMVEQLKEIGVDEVACLIDFGVNEDSVLASLQELAKLKDRSAIARDHSYGSTEKKTVETLPDQIKRGGITHLQCTPSLASVLLLEPKIGTSLGALQKLLLGGEALPISLVKQLDEVITGEIHNMYGPTETTIWSTTHLIEEGAGQAQNTVVPIGRPIANTQVYILDSHLQLLPVGIPGELFIGGKGVVRGYLNQPALTAEKFLPDPWSSKTGTFIYRTGDVARYRPDGTIEYLGRMDQQVKLRGHRIELGEIEATLRAYPGVQEAVVVLREEDETRKYLTAYVVIQREEQITQEDLQSHLRQQLPDYMLPATFLFLESLPLSPNGKVERSALPVPEQTGAGKAGYVAPQSELEQRLVEIWQEVLDLAQVGIHDNFFALGGDSILSLLILARARLAGWHLTLQQIFQHQTIAQLATVAEKLGPSEQSYQWSDGQSDVPLASLDQVTLDRLLAAREGQVEDIYPLTPLQQGLLFHTLYAPESGVFVNQLCYTLAGKVEVGAFELAWQQVIRRHATLRTAFVWRELSEPLQIVFKQANLSAHVLDWQSRSQEQQEADLEAFLCADRAQGFDMGQAPLMRLALVRLDETRTQVTWTHHHILFDGWSRPLLVQEVFAYYDAEIQGQSLVLEEPRPYRDYISWLAEQKNEEAEMYWQQTLAGINAPTALGVGHRMRERRPMAPLPTPQTPQGFAEVWLRVGPVTTTQWQEYVNRERVTFYTLVQAAWALVLSRYSGQSDVLFGHIVTGRPPELVGMERMVGLFTNTVPVRVQVKDEEEVGAWLRRLQEQQAEQRSYEYSSLAQVHRWSQVPQEHSLFESLLVFEDNPAQAAIVEREPVDLPYRLEVGTARVLEQTNYALTISSGIGQGPVFEAAVGYDRENFEDTTIERLLGHIQTVLEQFVADPQQPLGMVSLLTESEREQFPLSQHVTSPQDRYLPPLSKQREGCSEPEDVEAPFVSPRTPLEERLAHIWSDILGQQCISIHDSFFKLGGNSLQALQLSSRISTAINADIPVRHIFMYPTIAALAAVLDF